MPIVLARGRPGSNASMDPDLMLAVCDRGPAPPGLRHYFLRPGAPGVAELLRERKLCTAVSRTRGRRHIHAGRTGPARSRRDRGRCAPTLRRPPRPDVNLGGALARPNRNGFMADNLAKLSTPGLLIGGGARRSNFHTPAACARPPRLDAAQWARMVLPASATEPAPPRTPAT